MDESLDKLKIDIDDQVGSTLLRLEGRQKVLRDEQRRQSELALRQEADRRNELQRSINDRTEELIQTFRKEVATTLLGEELSRVKARRKGRKKDERKKDEKQQNK